VTVACPACRRPLPPATLRDGWEEECPFCRARIEITAFPALGRGLAPGRAAEALQADSEASCFNHPQKRAAVACDRCGRFLCGLCEVQIGEGHYCPNCLAANQGGTLPQLDSERMRWDRLALALAIYPVLGFWLPMVTAPMVMVIVWRYWSRPGSLVQPGRSRFVIAFALATLELAGIAAMIVLMIVAIRADL
jgi:hypothetical protein